MVELGAAQPGLPTGRSAHVDAYVRDHLPPAADWPRLDYSALPALAAIRPRSTPPRSCSTGTSAKAAARDPRCGSTARPSPTPSCSRAPTDWRAC